MECGFVYVDSPHLKNLIFVDTPQREVPSYIERISKFSGELTIYARDLTYLRIKGSYFPKLSLDGFPSLEKLGDCRASFYLGRTISHQPSSFLSLKSLKIYPSKGLKTLHLWDLKTYRLKSSLEILKTQTDEEQEAMKIKLSAEVTNYLLGSSSNATFTMVSYEEARAIKITIVAYRLMVALWEILEETKAYTDTKWIIWSGRRHLMIALFDGISDVYATAGNSQTSEVEELKKDQMLQEANTLPVMTIWLQTASSSFSFLSYSSSQ
ncbi:hypothetical protein Tco_0459154 [Tanacetum coccineum]